MYMYKHTTLVCTSVITTIDWRVSPTTYIAISEGTSRLSAVSSLSEYWYIVGQDEGREVTLVGESWGDRDGEGGEEGGGVLG